MNPSSDPRKQHALEVLADRALFGSEGAPELEAEIAQLVAAGVVSPAEVQAFENAATAVHLAASVSRMPLEPMPAALRDKVLQQAVGVVGGKAQSSRGHLKQTVPMVPRSVATPTPVATVTPLRARSVWLAMAACVALGFGLARAIQGSPGPSATLQEPPPNAELPPAAARAALLANAKDTVTLAWKPTEDSAAQGASGDVVWSASAQRGFMRFQGLAANDPRQSQYQLWIFDQQRDERYPVDGGVFDVTANGEVIVPIQARVRVGEAKLFAVTVEKPGGVVVSQRERIVTTAAPSG